MIQERCIHGMILGTCSLCLREKGRKSEYVYRTPPLAEEETTEEMDIQRDGDEGGDPDDDEKRFLDPAEVPFLVTRRIIAVEGNGDDDHGTTSLTPMETICSVCETRKSVHRNRRTGEPICGNCYNKDPSTHEQCSKCDKVKRVATRDKSGKAICDNCHRKDPSTHEQCSKCGWVKRVAIRDKSGKAICDACYRRSNLAECTKCKKTKVVGALGLCYACYRRQLRAKHQSRSSTRVSVF